MFNYEEKWPEAAKFVKENIKKIRRSKRLEKFNNLTVDLCDLLRTDRYSYDLQAWRYFAAQIGMARNERENGLDPSDYYLVDQCYLGDSTKWKKLDGPQTASWGHGVIAVSRKTKETRWISTNWDSSD